MKTKLTKQWRITICPGSHFDLGWVASPPECLAYGDEVIRKAVEVLEKEKDYRFIVEYALFLKHFLERHPEYYRRVKTLLHRNKLELGGTMTGGIEQILGGELLIRQFVMAKRWARSFLGYEILTAQQADLPGHVMQLPQILAQAGFRYLTYSRFHPGQLLHWYDGPAGASVLAANYSRYCYLWGSVLRGGLAKAERVLPQQIETVMPRYAVPWILMGDEEDLIMPYRDIVRTVGSWNQKHPKIRLRFGIPREYFQALPQTASLPRFKGEMPYGFYAIPACSPKTYQEARLAENKLLAAEKLAVMGQLLNVGRMAASEVDAAWLALCYPQDHNSGGRHGESTMWIRQRKAESAHLAAEELALDRMQSIIVHINYRRDVVRVSPGGDEPERADGLKVYYKPENGLPLVVFNPLSWERSEPVSAYIQAPGEGIVVPGGGACQAVEIADHTGKRLPAQITGQDSLWGSRRYYFTFTPEQVPPLGYRVFYVIPKNKRIKTRTDLRISKTRLENTHVAIDMAGGYPVRIRWKKKRTDIVAPKQGNYRFNELYVVEDERSDLEDALGEEEGGTPYNNFTGVEWRAEAKYTSEILERGPVKIRLRTQRRLLERSEVIQDVILYRDLCRIDLETEVIWQGRRDRQVRLAFPFHVPGGAVHYESPFAGVAYPADEMPGAYKGTGMRLVQNWIDISNERFGVTLATTIAPHLLRGTEIHPLLIKDGKSCADTFNYDNAGRYRFAFSLIPHQGPWQPSMSFRCGWEKNTPLLYAQIGTCYPIVPVAGAQYLPEQWSMCRVEPDHVIVSAAEPLPEAGGCQLRLFETDKRAVKAKIWFFKKPLRCAVVNLLGDMVKPIRPVGHWVNVPIKAQEILTLKVWFKGEEEEKPYD